MKLSSALPTGPDSSSLDTREQHQSDPPTRWFISETDYGRKLKIVFINTDLGIVIRTAYDPNSEETAYIQKIWRRYYLSKYTIARYW
jgi:hypothetical protein